VGVGILSLLFLVFFVVCFFFLLYSLLPGNTLFLYSVFFSLMEVFYCRGSFLMRLQMYIYGSFTVIFCTLGCFIFLIHGCDICPLDSVVYMEVRECCNGD